MENEDVIRITRSVFAYYDKTNDEICWEDRNEAYGIIIKALTQKPCEDAISRQKVLKLIKERCNPYGKPTIDFEEGKKLLKYIDNLPPVNPQPQESEG